MRKKIQSFYVFKFTSNRVRNAKYNINIDTKEARRNGELVSVAQNQVIETIMRLQGRTYDPYEISSLFVEKKKIKNKQSSKENIEKLVAIEERIDNILFVPEIISIQMDKKQHYKGVIESGIVINSVKFKRLLCGAGHSRRNTVIFVREDLELSLKTILNNGRNMETEISYAKNNAYFALTYSGKNTVTFPYSFAVIPDCETKRVETVDYIEDLTVVEKEIELDFNLFDGEGMISPRLAKQWSEDLGLEHVPSAFIIRNSFLKGMLCVFDYHKFSDECGIHIAKDVWGNEINVRDQDIIFTASQLKTWNAYGSCKEYIDNCKKNHMEFGVTRYTPEQDADYVFTNYQFLQVLNLSDEDVETLCSQTVEYLNDIILDSPEKSLLYMLGKVANEEFDGNIYEKLHDNVTKSLLLNNDLLKDPYIQSHLMQSLNKKIRESYIGNLIIDGNYSMNVADPFALSQHLFSLPVTGLLARDQHYNGYWNKKCVEKTVACRAPLTARSEVTKLNLVRSEDIDKWYEHLQNGVTIYNVNGCDCMYLADSD